MDMKLQHTSEQHSLSRSYSCAAVYVIHLATNQGQIRKVSMWMAWMTLLLAKRSWLLGLTLCVDVGLTPSGCSSNASAGSGWFWFVLREENLVVLVWLASCLFHLKRTSFKIKLHFSYAAAILAHPTLCLARLRKVPLSMMKVKWLDNTAKSLVSAETAQMQVWVDVLQS